MAFPFMGNCFFSIFDEIHKKLVPIKVGEKGMVNVNHTLIQIPDGFLTFLNLIEKSYNIRYIRNFSGCLVQGSRFNGYLLKH